VNRTGNQHEAGGMEVQSYCRPHPDFFLGLLFDTKDAVNVFQRNVGWFLPDYMVKIKFFIIIAV
jgi:hypothetical protein